MPFIKKPQTATQKVNPSITLSKLVETYFRNPLQFAEVLEFLKNSEIIKDTDDNGTAAFGLKLAMIYGHLGLLNCVLSFSSLFEDNNINLQNLSTTIQNGHLVIVNRLLELPCFLEHITDYSIRPLVEAVIYGHLAIVIRLLAIPAVIEKIGQLGSYPISATILQNHLAILNLLLAFSHQANIVAPEHLVIFANSDNRLAMLNRLLEIPGVAQDTFGLKKAFVAAAKNKQFDTLERLLEVMPNQYSDMLKETYPTIHQEIGQRRVNKVQAIKALAKWTHSGRMHLPGDLRNKILSFAYHDQLCGKRECATSSQDKSCAKIETVRKRFEKGLNS